MWEGGGGFELQTSNTSNDVTSHYYWTMTWTTSVLKFSLDDDILSCGYGVLDSNLDNECPLMQANWFSKIYYWHHCCIRKLSNERVLSKKIHRMATLERLTTNINSLSQEIKGGQGSKLLEVTPKIVWHIELKR